MIGKYFAGEEIWGRVEMVDAPPRLPGLVFDLEDSPAQPARAHRRLAGVSRDLRQAARFATPFTELSPALDFIREQFAKPMEVDALAKLAGVSARSFQRHFKKAFHITPTAYVRSSAWARPARC